jgi:hypothetical protein
VQNIRKKGIFVTELMKLKADLDVCYKLACRAYSKEFVDALLYEEGEDEPVYEDAVDGFWKEGEFI